MQLLAQKLRGINLTETKATVSNLTLGVINASTKSIVSSSAAKYTIIQLNGETRVRFLGVSYGNANNSYYYGFGFYNESDELFWTQAYEGRNDGGNNITKEYCIDVPEGAVSLICSVILASNTLNESNFYCYLESGDTIMKIIEPLFAGGGFDNNPSRTTEEGYIRYEDGLKVVTSETVRRLETFDVSAGQVFLIDCYSLAPLAATVSFFNNAIMGSTYYMSAFSIQANNSQNHIVVTVPTGAVKMAISSLRNYECNVKSPC